MNLSSKGTPVQVPRPPSYRQKVEDHYGVKYLGYYEVRGTEMEVFYQAEPKTELGHSNYMGLFSKVTGIDPKTGPKFTRYVCNAKGILDLTFPAIELPGGVMLCSRFTHDYQAHPCGAMIDGGPSYDRYNPEWPITHRMQIVGDQEIFTPVRKVATLHG